MDRLELQQMVMDLIYIGINADDIAYFVRAALCR